MERRNKKPKKKRRAEPVSVESLLAQKKSAKSKPRKTATPQKTPAVPLKHFASETFQADLGRADFKQAAELYRDRILSKLSERLELDEWSKRRLDWLKRRLRSGRAAKFLQNWIVNGNR